MREARSVARVLRANVVFPLVGTILLVVGWALSYRVSDYFEKRSALEYQWKQTGAQSMLADGGGVPAYTPGQREQLSTLNRSLIQDLSLGLAFLLIGAGVPVLVSRYLDGLVRANLSLLEQILSSSGRESSALMPQRFELDDFDAVLASARKAQADRADAKQRWKRAEEELVGANRDLMRKAEDLRKGRKVALSMMEDAELAREQLEKVNEQLKEAIEQARKAAREADIANHAKSDFLATMSHEIRTPLNGVIGFIDILAETNLDDEQKDCLRTIHSSGEALMSLINDILDFSKIEAGQLDLEVRPFNMVRMIRDVVSTFFNQAAKKQIDLSMEIGDDVPRRAIGDETRLRQIITNLISNAIKFTADGGVTLYVRCDSDSRKADTLRIEFEVRDTGIGMTEAQMDRLFKPFSQADSSTTRNYGGTGLGLAISKRLAEAMGGSIRAISMPGEGSSFFVSVRLREDLSTPQPGSAAETGSAPGAADAKPGELLPLKIAVAEDNQANQRVLQMLLKRLGWTADYFENGRDLIEHLKEAGSCDLILMDLQMPEMDGLEATRKIRAGAAGEAVRDVQIIALTANALSSDEDRCLAMGMNAYLSKPIKVAALRDKIFEIFPMASRS